MAELWKLSAHELASLVKDGQVSAREAAQSALMRLEEVNPRINAVIQLDAVRVQAQAEAIDQRRMRGEKLGVLAGVPVTVKVNVDQAGFATTNGVKLQQDLIAKENSPIVDAFLKADAIILGRTNTPAFSYRWFTNNLLHGHTYNPRDRSITPGGSSGGAASAVTAGIGHIAHGTDIAGSIRYPAYACGVHGLRPTLGRFAAYNASTGDRPPGPQLTAVSGPIARTIADLRLAYEALAVQDFRDPWWTPAPLDGPARPKKIAMCISPNGLQVSTEVMAAMQDARMRLADAGYWVEEVADTPPLKEAAALQVKLWMGDGYDAMVAAAKKEGDPGAIAALAGQQELVAGLDLAEYSTILLKRATFLRQWEQFLGGYAALLIPVSGEAPFADQLDLASPANYRRVWQAQMSQVGIPFMGLPGLTVSTGMNGNVPIGVQLIASRYREDLLLQVGQEIAARGAPPSPIDPA